MKTEIINDFKSFNWQKIIDYGSSLGDLNSAQFKFLKGLAIEFAIEKFADGDLSYVGVDHKDFDWPKHNISVEAKTQFSETMFTSKGQLRTSYSVILNNSRGTNKQTTVNADQVADCILVVKSDGAFAIDKQTVISKSKGQGDGFTLKVKKHEIIPITGKLTGHPKQLDLKNKFIQILKESLDNF